MNDYVLRICLRDPEHPLMEATLIEAGTPVSDPAAFADALIALGQAIKAAGTPEAVAKLMRKHQRILTHQKVILSGSK